MSNTEVKNDLDDELVDDLYRTIILQEQINMVQNHPKKRQEMVDVIKQIIKKKVLK